MSIEAELRGINPTIVLDTLFIALRELELTEEIKASVVLDTLRTRTDLSLCPLRYLVLRPKHIEPERLLTCVCGEVDSRILRCL